MAGNRDPVEAKLQEKRSSEKKTVSKNKNGQSKNEIEIQGRVTPRFVSFRLASEQVTGACRSWLTLHHNLMEHHGRLVHIQQERSLDQPQIPGIPFRGRAVAAS